ncbi:MAG: lysine--tRNA ligase [Clostridia bacterium]|nr:lysine--tRNA ligase [Clostridia bacterium]
MHWSEEIAQKIIARNPNKEEYVCAAGISPSGAIHIGNFRDVVTSYFVAKALRKMGKKARLLFSWDEFDRLRKIPVNVAEERTDMEQYLGYPYADVPDPFGCCDSYAQHFQKQFEKSIVDFGIEMDYRYQSQMYRAGKYADKVILALQHRAEIFDILDSFRVQDAVEGERENYYPVSIYCPHCHKDDTRIISLSEDCTMAEYQCRCGHQGTFDFTRDFNCKLAWKVDWPMRWQYEGVDFEPGGKDHASPTGSYQTSKIIAQKIFGYEAPLFQGYEFIGIKGSTGKMSGSSGLNLTPETLLKIYQPEIILWLYAKTDPAKAFNFCFDDGILRQYFEFDKQYNEYKNGNASELVQEIMNYCLIEGREIQTVPMALLVSLGSVVNFNVPMLETVFAKIGTPYKQENFQERLGLAQFWLEQCAPESVNRIRPNRNWEVYNSFKAEEKQEIQLLHDFLLQDGYGLEDLNTFLYSIPRQVYGESISDKDAKSYQGNFFKNVYQLLIDKKAGPRLYLFLYAIDKQEYLKLLDFSTPPQADEHSAAPTEAAEAVSSEAETKASVAPAAPQIEIEDFAKLDLRVCKILNCEEVKKSHSCYKLTLFDGIGERIIMSGVKKYYQPEQLIGKKIIVVANLKPAKIAGVKSNGMLLAGMHESCGCQIIFVNDLIPEGVKLG